MVREFILGSMEKHLQDSLSMEKLKELANSGGLMESYTEDSIEMIKNMEKDKLFGQKGEDIEALGLLEFDMDTENLFLSIKILSQ